MTEGEGKKRKGVRKAARQRCDDEERETRKKENHEGSREGEERVRETERQRCGVEKEARKRSIVVRGRRGEEGIERGRLTHGPQYSGKEETKPACNLNSWASFRSAGPPVLLRSARDAASIPPPERSEPSQVLLYACLPRCCKPFSASASVLCFLLTGERTL